MYKTYTVRLESALVKSIDSFVTANNQERLERLNAEHVDFATLPRHFGSRSDLIEQAVYEYLLVHSK